MDGFRNVSIFTVPASVMREELEATESSGGKRHINERVQSLLDHLVGNHRHRVYSLFAAVWSLGCRFFFAVHISADLAWYSLVAAAVAGGENIFWRIGSIVA